MPATRPTIARVHVTLEELVQLKLRQYAFSFLPNQPIHSLLSGRHTSRLRGRGLQFEELRRYRAGDDIRSIDWRATARKRQAHVRVYSEERERTVLFIIDQRNSMHFGSQRMTKAVAACELAALGAWRAIKAGDRVAAIIFNDEEIVSIPAQRSQSTIIRMCSELARINNELDVQSTHNSPEALNKALTQAVQWAKHDNLVILATDCNGADEETRKHVHRLAAHNDMIAALVYDPFGIQLPASRDLKISDGTTQQSLPDGKEFQKRYKECFSQWGVLIRDCFRALKIPILPLCTHDDVGEQVLRALGYNK